MSTRRSLLDAPLSPWVVKQSKHDQEMQALRFDELTLPPSPKLAPEDKLLPPTVLPLEPLRKVAEAVGVIAPQYSQRPSGEIVNPGQGCEISIRVTEKALLNAASTIAGRQITSVDRFEPPSLQPVALPLPLTSSHLTTTDQDPSWGHTGNNSMRSQGSQSGILSNVTSDFVDYVQQLSGTTTSGLTTLEKEINKVILERPRPLSARINRGQSTSRDDHIVHDNETRKEAR